MRKPVIQATAKSGNVIEVYVSKDFIEKSLKEFRFYEDGKFLFRIVPVSVSESHSSFIYTLLIKEFAYVPGKKYELATKDNYFIPIDISFLAQTPAFEKQYRYDGQLGAIYTPEETTFRVFSPFSDLICLMLQRKPNGPLETFVMEHDLAHGIFSLSVPGDLDRAAYRYAVRIFGEISEVVDPYSFSLDSNSRHGYVIDPKKVKAIETDAEELPPFDDRTKAIIYECSVRDMTSLLPLEKKGTYAALNQSGLKSPKGLPEGLDYLASLGVTHVQFQPVLDFQTVDDGNPKDGYNWGYDPEFFFAPEGSYSTDPSDPYARVKELRTLVKELHAKGLRVTLDVVYNHVFSEAYNSLSLLVPHYYFRYNGDGSLSNGSGCGNDFESRNYMARKLIIDSLLHLIDFFDVDGFRFDLMGILDIETMKKGYEATSKVKPNILYYGEGWDLWTNLPADQKASYFNSAKLPFCSFFNDRFRDVVKGKANPSELLVNGYLLGDSNYLDGFKHVFLGSSVALAFAPMFSSPSQSLNYVECHDNNTLYDKIVTACPGDKPEEVLKRIRLCNLATLFSVGIPFFHEGQEIGHSKGGIADSYQAGDKVNGFDYALLDKRKDLYFFFKDALELKKRFITLCGDEYDSLSTHITFENLPNGAVKVNYLLRDFTLAIIFNPSKQSFTYSFEDYVNLIFNDSGNVEQSDFYIRLAIINALSVNVFLSKKETPLPTPEAKEKKA
jgi:pullulanase